MAKIKWNRNKVLPSAINSGSEFTTDDDLTIQELNAMVNNSFYGVDFVEGMTENPVVEESDPSATPSVELVDYTKVIDGTERTFKKFKFNNIKGQQGIKGDKGEKGKTGIGFDTITNETLNTEVVDYNIDTGANIQMTNFITFNDGTNKSINTEINLNIKGTNGINIDTNETNDGLVISSEGSKGINLVYQNQNITTLQGTVAQGSSSDGFKYFVYLRDADIFNSIKDVLTNEFGLMYLNVEIMQASSTFFRSIMIPIIPNFDKNNSSSGYTDILLGAATSSVDFLEIRFSFGGISDDFSVRTNVSNVYVKINKMYVFKF